MFKTEVDLESQTEELESPRNTTRKHEDAIKDLSAQLFNATHTHPSSTSNTSNTTDQAQAALPNDPSQTSTGKFVIGDKVYVWLPIGSSNEGAFIEKEGRIKNGYEEKTVQVNTAGTRSRASRTLRPLCSRILNIIGLRLETWCKSRRKLSRLMERLMFAVDCRSHMIRMRSRELLIAARRKT
jgi:hypothetical protein